MAFIKTNDIIETPIGSIIWSVNGSLDLVELMEALDTVVKQEGVKGLLDHLREGFAV